ncbi:helix-turn-helix domain-containing protein [Streptomyces liangshanensis]|nr:helix-turn-helix domain-containing protein [Streptomyces liangshanensis]
MTAMNPDDSRSNILRQAMNVVEMNLDNPDLSPALVARTVGVSLRTLHREFSALGDSLMSFARRRRLQRAYADLAQVRDGVAISDVAARWCFSDASHFIKTFRSVYGTTPAAYLRTLKS